MVTRLVRAALAVLVTGVLLAGSAALAQEAAPADAPDLTKPATLKDVADAKDAASTVGTDAKQMANMAWLMTSAAFVLLMIPGLALFYGGMVRKKNLLGTIMHSMIALGIVGVQWVVVGYALAFGATQSGYIGWSPELLFLGTEAATGAESKFKIFPNTDLPLYLHAIFQGMFAIITAALISGAFAERVKFGAYCLFILLWTTLVYDPLAHWVWSFNWDKNADGALTAAGWLGEMCALDFAGGTVVHIAAGFSGLAAILVLRKRIGYGKMAIHPNSMVLTLLGAGMLWFGWFGFNAGSAVASTKQAVSAFAVTQIAAATAGLAWVLVEWCHKGKPTALGFASGVVAGLVGITPAAGFVDPAGALIIGCAVGVLCYGSVLMKGVFGYDDSLDAFGVHGVGGFIGAVLTGVLVSIPLWSYGTGLEEKSFGGVLADGKWDKMGQLKVQVIASCVSAAYAFIVTAVLVLLIDKTIGFTLSAKDEAAGLDLSQHGEVGFDYGAAGGLDESPVAVEPKAAHMPPNGELGKRFTVVVEGPDTKTLMKAWSGLCQTGAMPPSPAFKAVYPHLTTVSGNKFRFRGGDPVAVREQLQTLFEDALNGGKVKTFVES